MHLNFDFSMNINLHATTVLILQTCGVEPKELEEKIRKGMTD